jgi:hypothetical protein
MGVFLPSFDKMFEKEIQRVRDFMRLNSMGSFAERPHDAFLQRAKREINVGRYIAGRRRWIGAKAIFYQGRCVSETLKHIVNIACIAKILHPYRSSYSFLFFLCFFVNQCHFPYYIEEVSCGVCIIELKCDHLHLWLSPEQFGCRACLNHICIYSIYIIKAALSRLESFVWRCNHLMQ